jgi:hypothetical protein
MAAVALVLAVQSCGDHPPEPPAPCYTVRELQATGLAITDTSDAEAAFEQYLDYLDESNGYPVFDLIALEYLRSAGIEDYQGHRYWGIVAHGVQSTEGQGEVRMFRVREDGTVVLMLGCI